MAKILTPEKKAQLKKAVLDTIEGPKKSPVKAKIVASGKPASVAGKPVLATAKPAISKISSVARPKLPSAPPSKVTPKLKEIKRSSITMPSFSLNCAKKESDWDDKFFNSKFSTDQAKGKKNKVGRKIVWIIGIIVVLIILFFVFDIFAIYRLGWKDNFSRGVATALFLPAVSVDGNNISMKQYLDDLDLLEYALSNEREGVAPSQISQNNQKSVLDRLISIEVASAQLAKYGKSVSDEDLDKNLQNLISQFENREEAEKSVQKLYGINLEQFKNKVLRPLLERDLLKSLLVADNNLSIGKEAKEEADEVLKLAQKDGVVFSELAKQYTDDEAGINTGGDLGYVNRGELPEEIEKALFALPENTVYDKVIKNGLGYHIFYVENKITDKETGKETIKLKQIFIEIDVNKYINDLIESAKVKKFVKVD